MKKFHISKDGVARECRASKGKCRLNQRDDQHFNTRDAAQDFADQQNKQKYGSIKKINKKNSSFKKIEERNIRINHVQNITKDEFNVGSINSSTVDVIDEKPSIELLEKIYSEHNLYHELQRF